jgi:basic amino acid/polyamine antiporter, APA family
MVGAGVFFVWAPAVSLAGGWVLVALVIAGMIALLNALSIAQLSLSYPVSGGVYSFATRYVSPRAGFLAGWLFLAGKTSSAAAIALIAARYFFHDHAPWIAAGLVIVLALVNISGIRVTAAVSGTIAAVVVSVLVLVSVLAVTTAPSFDAGISGSLAGVMPAAGLLFFAFAGYARMATLGEEVRNPRQVLPRVIVGTLVGVLVLYALVGFAVLSTLGEAALAVSRAPVAEVSPESLVVVVVVAAALASLGSLATVLAGLSRVSLAMARDGNLPGPLARVWGRTSSPAVAEGVVAAVAIVLVLTLDPVWLVGASAGSVLLYYALAHWSALAQPPVEQVVWRGLPIIGLVGCVVLAATLPVVSTVTTVVLVAGGLLFWEVKRKFYPTAS